MDTDFLREDWEYTTVLKGSEHRLYLFQEEIQKADSDNEGFWYYYFGMYPFICFVYGRSNGRTRYQKEDLKLKAGVSERSSGLKI